jgi:hypothetical protein
VSTTPASVSGLIGVYDADGGVAGELRYVVGHLLGRAECSLCDITHGRVRRKAAFDALRVRLGVPFEVVHRNERRADVAAATGDALPCVLAVTGTGLVVLLDGDELRACGGDVDRFETALRAAVSAGDLTLG